MSPESIKSVAKLYNTKLNIISKVTLILQFGELRTGYHGNISSLLKFTTLYTCYVCKLYNLVTGKKINFKRLTQLGRLLFYKNNIGSEKRTFTKPLVFFCGTFSQGWEAGCFWLLGAGAGAC